jgi:hypothetical protein
MVDAIDLGEDFEAQDTVFAFGALWVADFERGTIVGLSPEALSG